MAQISKGSSSFRKFWATSSTQGLVSRSGYACLCSRESAGRIDLDRPEWDSNPRITDLQSVPLVRLGIRPRFLNSIATFGRHQVELCRAAHRSAIANIYRVILVVRVTRATRNRSDSLARDPS